MKFKEFLVLLGVAIVAAAAAGLANFPLWFGVTLYALSFIVAFGVSFVVEQVDKWKQHRRKVKDLLDADKAKTDWYNRLQKNQLEVADYSLAVESVKEEVESIRENLLKSIEYEEASIVKKQQDIEGYKQLLSKLEEVSDNEKNNKETKTL